MSNLTPTALRLQRILDAHGIEGIAREVALKDARIAELEAILRTWADDRAVMMGRSENGLV
jgi:hypothetical protein